MAMTWASTYITIDLAWPWNLPGVGWPALAAVALLLSLLSVWTYLGVPGITRGRLLSILALRLAALAVACLLVLRPSLARQQDENILPSKLLILVDNSESMNLTDEFNNRSRWDHACYILSAPAVTALLKDLAENQKVEVDYYQGAEGITKFDPQGQPTGKRTDMGTWLHDLWDLHGRETSLRGLALFSDGADNGTRYSTLKQAAFWNSTCPISTFGLGKPNTTLNQRDIALAEILPPLQPVPVKTEFAVRGRISAPGFENTTVDVSLWIEDLADGEMKPALNKKKGIKERIILRKTHDNEVTLIRDAPLQPGEYKITLKVDPLPGEITDLNNQISSYITVTKEGVSILWVEGRKRLESAFALRYALGKDRRFRLYPAEKLSQAQPGAAAGQEDWFNFNKQHYDVIVIGDITAKRFSDDRREIFQVIKEKVTREGTGLLMIGGLEAFANSDWSGYLAADLADLLPVVLNKPGQVDGPVRMRPTVEGKNHFLLRLADNSLKNDEIWDKTLDPLDGMTPVGTPKPSAAVLAVGDNNEPVLVGTQVGEGRVLVFGGDTTWKTWRRSPEMLPAYERFWKQTMLWLARQENIEGNAWIKPDTRRIAAGSNQRLGFSVGMRGKGGIELSSVQYQVQVTGPAKDITDVPLLPEGKEQRGYFLKTSSPGEYRIQVTAKGKDLDGKEVEGKASTRFLAYAEELENLRPAADHDFLGRLALTGSGRFHLADERQFVQFLKELQAQKQQIAKPRVDLWPDWRRNPPTTVSGQKAGVRDQLTTLWHSAALPCLVLFVSFLSLEWYLRRKWGLV